MKNVFMALVSLSSQFALAAGETRFTCNRGDEHTIELDTALGQAAYFDNDSWTYFFKANCTGGESVYSRCVYASDSTSAPMVFDIKRSNGVVEEIAFSRSRYECHSQSEEFNNGEF